MTRYLAIVGLSAFASFLAGYAMATLGTRYQPTYPTGNVVPLTPREHVVLRSWLNDVTQSAGA